MKTNIKGKILDEFNKEFDEMLKKCVYSSISSKDKFRIKRFVIDYGKELFKRDLKSRLKDYYKMSYREWIDVSDIEEYIEKI